MRGKESISISISNPIPMEVRMTVLVKLGDEIGLRQMIEELMIQRISENDKIVTRYMDDKEFGDAAFGVLSKSIYESIPSNGEALAEISDEIA